MDKDEISNFLKSVPLFKGIPDEDFDDIAEKFTVRKYNAAW